MPNWEHRFVGVVYHHNIPERASHYIRCKLAEEFDALVHIRPRTLSDKSPERKSMNLLMRLLTGISLTTCFCCQCSWLVQFYPHSTYQSYGRTGVAGQNDGINATRRR